MQPLSSTDPRTAGEFTLRARLGAGGMGRVYLGYSPAGRAVAVKVVHPELARDEEFLARFRNEVAAARVVSGLYTAPVVASGLDDDPPWMASVYVPGPALDSVVNQNGPFPEPALWRLAAGLSEALQAVHASGLVHRDLKPSNVLLAADGPHVIDFGISRAMGGTHLTATGMVVGTPGYMSPEQAEGQEAGAPSDVFSLACVVAYAATGKQPFGTGSAASVLYRVVAGQPELDGTPRALRDVLEACLRKDPAQRPLLPAVAAAFSRGAGMVGDGMESPTSFWPQAIADIIRESSQGTPGASGLRSGPVSGLRSGSGVPQSPPTGVPQSPPTGVPRSPVPGAVPSYAQPQGGPYTGHPGAYTGQPGVYTPPPVFPSAYQPPSYGPTPAPFQSPGPPTPPPGAPWHTPAPQAPYPAAGGGTGYQAAGFQAAGFQAPGFQAPGQPSVQQPAMQPPGQQAPVWGAAPQGPLAAQPGPVPWTGPGIGQPSMVGSAYRPGRRKPARSELPPPVVGAIRVMYAGLGVTILAFIIGIVDMVHLDHLAATTADASTQSVDTTSLGILAVFAFLGGIVGFVFWPLCAYALRKGRQWGAVLGTVFFGLDLASMLFVLIGAHDAPASRILSLIIWGLGLAAVILAWTPASRAFYRAFR